eukprot:1151440-Pelagomonas_calceolata.AAC.11
MEFLSEFVSIFDAGCKVSSASDQPESRAVGQPLETLALSSHSHSHVISIECRGDTQRKGHKFCGASHVNPTGRALPISPAMLRQKLRSPSSPKGK